MRCLKKIKLRLYKESPFCFYCGIRTKIYKQEDGKKLPNNTATVDHIYTLHERKRGENVPKVLSCWKCNNTRGMINNRSVQLKNWKFHLNVKRNYKYLLKQLFKFYFKRIKYNILKYEI